MTGKQRNYLRAMAVNMKSSAHIGKNGLTDSVLNELSELLENKELIKITLLKNALCNPKDIMKDVINSLKAEPIAVIGYKIVIYRKSSKDDIEHIVIPK